ncbi:MAG: hypothetical protein HQ562_04065 [Candidatus Marinimicrobia bacterium]|nr:hypothetical protein [Candidatus Neomarinimicrobiota bacterium]
MRILIATTILITALFAQVDWYGYYEAEADYFSLPDNQFYFGYHKFRLDLDSAPNDRIRVSANIVSKYYDGASTFNFMEFIDQTYWPELPVIDKFGNLVIDSLDMPLTDVLDELPYQLSDTLFLDNIFLEFHHDRFDLTLGRQQIPSGVGYAWNPTDLFNTKDMMDPTYEDTGVPATRIDVPFGLSTTFTGILQLKDTWDNTTQYYQAKTGLGNFDLSLIYGRFNYSETSLKAILIDSLGQFGLSPGAKIPIPDTQTRTRELFGFNAEGELFGLGARAELAVNRLDYDSDSLKYEFIIGGDYTFDNSLYLLGEFYHNDFGVKVDDTEFDDYLIFLAGQRKSLNQNYFFLMAMYPLTDLLSGSLFGIANLDDGSLAINPQLTYNIFEDVELSLLVSVFVGDDRDEFGYQSAGLRLRLRAYF